MKQLTTAFFLLVLSCVANAQTFGNEWINFNQKYFSFPIYHDGLYKIDYATLTANSIPVNGYSASEIQLFGREKEIPLYMVDGGDNVFGPGDYFLFLGQGNDGWLDSTIVTNPAKLANPNYSLISDTNYYFFTWKTGGTGLRYTVLSDANYTNYTPVNYIEKTIESAFRDSYVEGVKLDHASGSIYAPGEGYGFNELESSSGAEYSVGIASANPYFGADAPLPFIEVRSTSNSDSPSTSAFNHHLKLSAGTTNTVICDSLFNAYMQIKIQKELPATAVSHSGTVLRYQIIGDVGALVDRQVLTYYRLKYPRLAHANGETEDHFEVKNSTTAATIRIDFVGYGGSNPIVFNHGTTHGIQFPTFNGAGYPILIPNTSNGASTKIDIYAANQAVTIPSFHAINGTGSFVAYDVQNLDSALLFVYPTSQEQATMNYAAYRTSAAGGAYNVVLANIEDLMYQFGGGVPHHPNSIRRFTHFVVTHSNLHPSGLFLLGKGMTPTDVRNSANAQLLNEIPTFGYPSSDVALTCNLNGAHFEPLVPTGRIASRSNQELQDYLDKITTYELAQQVGSNFSQAKDWQKQILHFVGGSNATQQASFQYYMGQMQHIIEDSMYAGNVTNFYKTSSDPLDPTVVSGVTERIDNGVSLMNFFGHAAASNNGFEINIDEPGNWNNTGKYPVVIGNSCYNGDIFTGSNSTSERFVLLPDKGAISFLSSVFVGYDTYLYYYTSELYRQFSNKNVGKPIGYQIQQTIKNLEQTTVNLIMETTFSQMVYHGDPMIKLNFNTLPEIEIKPENITFSPSDLNLNVDSIQVDLDIKNLGLSIQDTVILEIKRDFPGSAQDSVYTYILPELNYLTHFSKKYPLQPNIGVGINQFTFTIDIPSAHAEGFEEIANNTTVKNFFINIDGINPIWPYNYAVVPDSLVTVKASTINPIAGLKTYLFEMDTTDTYNSPQYRKFSITEQGGVKEVAANQWQSISGAPFPLICQDSTVYFWRVAVDSSILNWSEFSFQYIEGKEGWGQDHFYQFKNNEFNNITYNRSARLREFPLTQLHTIGIDVFETTDSYYSLFNAWMLDGGIQDYATCGYLPGIYVGVIDPVTLQPWKTHCPTGSPANNDPTMNFSNVNNNCGCRNRYEFYFIFDQTDPVQLAGMQNMLENQVPDGHYIVMYTPFATLYDQLDLNAPSIYSFFQSVGAPQINNTQAHKPFALFYQKGTQALTQVKVWPQDTVPATADFPAKLTISADVYKPDYIGFESTPIIGPALNWKTVYWRRDSLESPATDSVRLRIQGLDNAGSLLTTIDTVFSPNDSLTNLNAILDAATYPQLRLQVYYNDILHSTPAQVDRLHVLFTPVPEAAIDGTSSYFLNPLTDTLFEGQPVSFAVDVKNVSTYSMDSLLVHYWVEDANHVRNPISYPRQMPLNAGQILRDTVTFSTLNLAGLNSLWMEVNPYVNGSLVITDQPEQYHFNNLLQLPFTVAGDDQHPILDVTFNGNHILNGDIIDPTSEIVISLKDENPYLVMNDISDTTHFGIYLTDPQGIQRRIPFMDGNGNTVMQWIPAESQYKKFKIIYPKEFELSGMYTLIVQGTDRSGNLSGDYEYRVNFEIIRESSITQMMNYPNPFSTSTHFVFTLTGTQTPDDILIQIMTVTGRVVKEINEQELGTISIGRNVTSYAWDGTDNFGDPLANGVYLYRVRAKIGGEEIKRRASGADSYFKEEFGKMYLFR